MKTVFSTILAVALPILVAVGTVTGLEAFRDREDQREMRNAGKIINGVVRKGGTVQWIESKLRETQPDIVILGNSLSNTDINPGLLARRLGIPSRKVQRFSIPNSLGPHWYAILKNRVYENGYAPRAVLILSDMQSLLATDPRSEAAYLNLTVQLGDDEPVIDEKLGRSAYWWDRIRENKGRLRDKTLKDLRNLAVNLFWLQEVSTEERHRTNQALELVFSDANTDMSLHNNVIPIFNTKQKELYAYDPSELPTPKESFIPDITSMVSDNDGKVLYLRPPMSPLLPAYAGDQVLPGVEEKVARMVEKQGGYYLDMRGLKMNAGHYINLDHMNNEGARRFTEALAQAMIGIDAMQTRRRREAAEAELFTAVAFEDGALLQLEVAADFKGVLPDIGVRDWEQGKFGRAYFEIPALEALSDRRTMEVTPFAARCSPLRVVEEGKTLPLVGVSCDEVFKHGKGRTCHVDDRLYFAASDETTPHRNDRRYRLGFDPGRSCEGAVWLYPGDRVRLSWPQPTLASLQRGARQLRLEAIPMLDRGAGQGGLDLKLKVSGKVALEDTLSLERVRNGPKGWRLPKALQPEGKEIELLLSNDSDAFLLVTSAVLSERGDAVDQGEGRDD